MRARQPKTRSLFSCRHLRLCHSGQLCTILSITIARHGRPVRAPENSNSSITREKSERKRKKNGKLTDFTVLRCKFGRYCPDSLILPIIITIIIGFFALRLSTASQFESSACVFDVENHFFCWESLLLDFFVHNPAKRKKCPRNAREVCHKFRKIKSPVLLCLPLAK